jgi:hypothetical protein
MEYHSSPLDLTSISEGNRITRIALSRQKAVVAYFETFRAYPLKSFPRIQIFGVS